MYSCIDRNMNDTIKLRRKRHQRKFRLRYDRHFYNLILGHPDNEMIFRVINYFRSYLLQIGPGRASTCQRNGMERDLEHEKAEGGSVPENRKKEASNGIHGG